MSDNNPYSQTGLSEGFARGFGLAVDQQRQNSDSYYKQHELELEKLRGEREGAYQQGMLGIEGKKTDIESKRLDSDLAHRKVEEGQAQEGLNISSANQKSENTSREATARHEGNMELITKAGQSIEAGRNKAEADYQGRMATTAEKNAQSEADYRKSESYYKDITPYNRALKNQQDEILKIESDITRTPQEKKTLIKGIEAAWQPALDRAAIQSNIASGSGYAASLLSGDTEAAPAAPGSAGAPDPAFLNLYNQKKSGKSSPAAPTAPAPITTNPSSITNPPQPKGLTPPAGSPPGNPLGSYDSLVLPRASAPAYTNGSEGYYLDSNNQPQRVYK